MAILTYHAVDPGWSAPLSVSPDLFTRHLEWLGNNRRVVAMEDALVRHHRPRRDEVVITFDDGFASVAEHALPALRARRMPTTMFLVGKTLDESGGTVDWLDRPPEAPIAVLSPDQILELSREGVAFGCHSYSHRDLTSLGYEACLEDLRRGREVLQDLLKHEVTTLAYPFGLHDGTVRRAAADAGFRWGFAMAKPPRATGPYGVPRVGIYPNDTLARVRMKTHPWYGLVRSSALYPALYGTRASLGGRRRG